MPVKSPCFHVQDTWAEGPMTAAEIMKRLEKYPGDTMRLMDYQDYLGWKYRAVYDMFQTARFRKLWLPRCAGNGRDIKMYKQDFARLMATEGE